MNNISTKEFQEIKNKTLTVVSFTKTGKRTVTCIGISYKKAIEHVIKQQSRGLTCLIFNTLPATETSWDIKDYDKYKKAQ